MLNNLILKRNDSSPHGTETFLRKLLSIHKKKPSTLKIVIKKINYLVNNIR